MKPSAKSLERWIDFLFILTIAAIAYLPLVSQLGYYRDDWHVTWGGSMAGAAKIFDLHLTDRPFMGLIYSLTYSVLGNSPLAWQLYIVALRIAGGLLFLWLVRLLWPGKRMATVLMALLFTIYPGFLQMPTASAYSNHFVGLGLGILSLALTVKALQVSSMGLRIGMVVGGVLSGVACFLIMEYMISLEGVRILLLGYLLMRGQPGKYLEKAARLLKIWLPYGAGLLVFLTWRLFFFKSARATTDVGSLARSYLAEPVYMFGRIILETLKGLVNALWMAWSVPFYNATMPANPVNLWTSLGLALLAITILWIFLRLAGGLSSQPQAREDNDLWVETQENSRWGKEAVLLGLLVALINVIPIVLANRDIRLTDTMDRYTLPASMGAVMVVVGAGYWAARVSLRLVILTILVGVSVFTHYNNAIFFKNFWTVQKQLWWQLSWRAPDLKTNTVLIPSLPSPYMLAESYEVWGPANLMYGSSETPTRIVGEALNTESMHSITTRGSFNRSMRRVQFTLDFKNSLILTIPAPGDCLRVVDADWLEYAENESTLLRQVAPMSQSSLLLTEGSHQPPPVEIFGAEPEHTWCYYYEKASLARQKEDWAEVARLGDEARSLGFQPQDGMEWMPFYQGYAYLRRMDEANELAGLIRAEEVALKEFCTQFPPERVSQFRKGSIDEFIIINLCPQP